MEARLTLKQLLELTNPKPLRNDLHELNSMVANWKTQHNILQCLSYPEKYVESVQAITNFVSRLLTYCTKNEKVDYQQISDIIRERYGIKFFYSDRNTHRGMYALDLGNIFLLIDINHLHREACNVVQSGIATAEREQLFVGNADNLHYLGKYAVPLVHDWLDFCTETGLDLKNVYTYASTLLNGTVAKERDNVYRFNFYPSKKHFLIQVE